MRTSRYFIDAPALAASVSLTAPERMVREGITTLIRDAVAKVLGVQLTTRLCGNPKCGGSILLGGYPYLGRHPRTRFCTAACRIATFQREKRQRQRKARMSA